MKTISFNQTENPTDVLKFTKKRSLFGAIAGSFTLERFEKALVAKDHRDTAGKIIFNS